MERVNCGTFLPPIHTLLWNSSHQRPTTHLLLERLADGLADLLLGLGELEALKVGQIAASGFRGNLLGPGGRGPLALDAGGGERLGGEMMGQYVRCRCAVWLCSSGVRGRWDVCENLNKSADGFLRDLDFGLDRNLNHGGKHPTRAIPFVPLVSSTFRDKDTC